jgi:DNA-binding CsgD family transcriptional regulator
VIRADVRAGIARLDLALALLEDQEVALDRVTVVFSAGIRALEKAREYDRAIKWIDAGITHASRHGAYADSAIFRAHRAAVERELGRLDSAHTLALQAVNDLRDANRAELREALVILGDICRVRGDTAGAREAYQEARDLGDPFADVGEALVVLAENRPAEAAHALAAALEQRPPGHHLLALRVLPPLIEALVRSENLPAATIALRRLQAEVERSDYRVGTQAQLYADGLVTSLAGDVSSARRALELSAEGWKAAGFPFEHARALAALSSILIAHGLTDDGVRVAREALDIFEEIGAEGESERLRRMLRKVGVRHRSVRQEQADATPFGLTARELQVLTHMSRGSTNRQIAAELGISEKTVSIHVSHVLAKLHCATRTQAARIAMDNGLS